MSCADYPNSPIANCETHENQSWPYRVSDDDFAGLFSRVFLIFTNSGERIGEDPQGFPKVYAVGCLIRLCLFVEMLRRIENSTPWS